MTDAAPQAPSTTKRLRIEWLDGLRALAALYVLLHHAWATVWPINQGVAPEEIAAPLTSWMAYGHVGVTVFIVLAGFSLTIGVAPQGGKLRGGFFGFMGRRAWRIIPPYWAALGVTLVLALLVIPRPTGTHWDQSVPLEWTGVLVNFLLLQDLVPVQDVSYVFWSIAVEWHIYLMFPLMLLVWRRWNLYVGAAVGIGIGLGGVMAARFVEYVNGLWPAYYAAFAFGMLASAMANDPPAWVRRVPIAWVGLIGTGGVLVVVMMQPYAWLVARMKPVDLALAAVVALLLLGLALGQARGVSRALSTRGLASIGIFSYSVYLIHAPLIQIGWQYLVDPFELGRGWQFLIMLGVVVPLAVFGAYLFHRFCEQPFIGRAPWDRKERIPASPVR